MGAPAPWARPRQESVPRAAPDDQRPHHHATYPQPCRCPSHHGLLSPSGPPAGCPMPGIPPSARCPNRHPAHLAPHSRHLAEVKPESYGFAEVGMGKRRDHNDGYPPRQEQLWLYGPVFSAAPTLWAGCHLTATPPLYRFRVGSGLRPLCGLALFLKVASETHFPSYAKLSMHRPRTCGTSSARHVSCPYGEGESGSNLSCGRRYF